MYIREIPEQFRPEIKAIMERQKTALYMPIADRQVLFNYYYRYIYKLRNGENIQGKIKQDITCGSCIGKVIHYFKNAVQQW
jgi:hypothetical protein